MNFNKGRSPFNPGQPVSLEFFTGRDAEIQRIERSLSQVQFGKPQALFLTGEYGIGKTSLAGYSKSLAEKKYKIFGIHVLLGGVETVEEVTTKTVEAIIKAQPYEPSLADKSRDFLSKYVGQQEIFGVKINLQELKKDSLELSHGFLPLLKNLFTKLKENQVQGIMLIFDEINGISKNPKFAHFIKTLIDENALSQEPLPLLLMLCGIDEKRRDLIKNHQPVERIFDVLEIKKLSKTETEDFFTKTFASVGIEVEPKAMDLMCQFSDGLAKVAHVIGENTFWEDKDNKIDTADAASGIYNSAIEIGTKFFDQQVYQTLQSKDYQTILSKLAKTGFGLTFKKAKIETMLSETEKNKFHNFLQKMKKLNVLKAGEKRGDYIFTSSLVRTYIHLKFVPLEENR
ncbi:ATP-binding protein [bacterium]|nr:ATP-binding protein [bacterium]